MRATGRGAPEGSASAQPLRAPRSGAAAARQVADRALKTINFREEQEKFNVWVARLNLENLYVLCVCVCARALACSYLFRCACRL